MEIKSHETIWKFEIRPMQAFEVEAPKGARFISAKKASDGDMYIWAIVNPSEEKVKRVIRVCGTGHQLNPIGDFNFTFIDTIIDDIYVWHIFEVSK